MKRYKRYTKPYYQIFKKGSLIQWNESIGIVLERKYPYYFIWFKYGAKRCSIAIWMKLLEK